MSNLDMSYKNLSARANCSISLLCAFRRFFSSDVGTYFKSCKQTSKQENMSYTHFQRKNQLIKIFREKATRVLNGFHVGLVSWSNWNLQMLRVFWRGIMENLEKNPLCKTRNNNKLKQIYSTGSESIPGHSGGRRMLSPLRNIEENNMKSKNALDLRSANL